MRRQRGGRWHVPVPSRPAAVTVSATAVAAAQRQLARARRDHGGPDRQAGARRRDQGRRAQHRAGRARLGDLDQPRHRSPSSARARGARRRGGGAQRCGSRPWRRRRVTPSTSSPARSPSGREADAASSRRRAAGCTRIFDASDAIGALAALQAFLAREDALTSPAAGAVHYLALRDLLRSGGERRRAGRRHRGDPDPPLRGARRDRRPDLADRRRRRGGPGRPDQATYLSARQTLGRGPEAVRPAVRREPGGAAGRPHHRQRRAGAGSAARGDRAGLAAVRHRHGDDVRRPDHRARPARAGQLAARAPAARHRAVGASPPTTTRSSRRFC